MSKIGGIQALVRNGLYYLKEHADDEAITDGFDIYDIEYGILNGKIRRAWPKEGKYEIVGVSSAYAGDHGLGRGGMGNSG